MKKILFLVFGFLMLGFSAIPAALAETLTLDPMHTYVLWHINHFGFSSQAGKWYATGTLIIDQNNLNLSKVNASIQVADVITGIPELDKHLKGKLFFDVAQFPTATFVSDKVDVTGKTTANVHGMLTLHGVTKPVTLKVTLNKTGVNPISNKMTAGFSATTVLKRSDFGINTLVPGLSDEVKLDINSEAFDASAGK